jgi:NAD(P)-dependent dehydrogenase (short-subunit alcohol dehydrogenase family)
MSVRPVAIITGAGRGMGAACARELATRGFAVALMSPSGASRRLAAELGGIGLDGSVTAIADLAKLIDMTLSTYGRIDAVVNNTGHAPRSSGASLPYDPKLETGLIDIPDEDWYAGLDLVLLNVVRTARLVTPVMQKQGSGAIVNISTFAAPEPRLSYPISSSLRLALAGYTKLYADRYARAGIRMNNVLPGFMENWPVDDAIRRTIPMARPGRFEEIGKTVAFLLSSDASYITGQNILVDGGVNRHI